MKERQRKKVSKKESVRINGKGKMDGRTDGEKNTQIEDRNINTYRQVKLTKQQDIS